MVSVQNPADLNNTNDKVDTVQTTVGAILDDTENITNKALPTMANMTGRVSVQSRVASR